MLENVDDDQIDDLVDDALQYFQERHFDGVERTYLKHQVNQTEIDQARETTISSSATSTVGVSRTIIGQKQQTLFKYLIVLLELKRYLNLKNPQFPVECSIFSINYF